MMVKKSKAEIAAAAAIEQEANAVRGKYFRLCQEGYSREEAAYLAQKGTRWEVPKQPSTPPQVKPFERPVEVKAKPVVMPEEAVKDDLTKITGVSPGMVKKLHDLGVNTYAQVAWWTDKDVVRFDKELNLRGRIKREEWVKQAKRLLNEQVTDNTKW